jgi:hypothetical protein
VRFAFIDEGGISKYEPFVVVAAALVHGDRQLIHIENELGRLVRKHNIPDSLRSGFRFHATDIWSGTGKVFGDKSSWPPPKRYDLLREIARVPNRFDVPIVYGAVERASLTLPADEELSTHQKLVGAHVSAFVLCTLEIEDTMRKYFDEEIAQIVAEDNDAARAALKQAHALLRDPDRLKRKITHADLLPLHSIRNSIHFATKEESSPLQLADVAAFLIRGHLAGKYGDASFRSYKQIRRAIVSLPAKEAAGYRVPFTASPPYQAFWPLFEQMNPELIHPLTSPVLAPPQ